MATENDQEKRAPTAPTKQRTMESVAINDLPPNLSCSTRTRPTAPGSPPIILMKNAVRDMKPVCLDDWCEWPETMARCDADPMSVPINFAYAQTDFDDGVPHDNATRDRLIKARASILQLTTLLFLHFFEEQLARVCTVGIHMFLGMTVGWRGNVRYKAETAGWNWYSHLDLLVSDAIALLQIAKAGVDAGPLLQGMDAGPMGTAGDHDVLANEGDQVGEVDDRE
ncbi:hypothetical protein GGF32_007910 [Allomyces javanicus]|nr:hypothetical protein GGF32_007910 [Allomyces javanicus]